MNLKNNPEFIPLIEWWEKDGKRLTVWLLAAAIAVGGWQAWKHHRLSLKIAASDALVSSYTTEELEDAVAKFSGSKAVGAIKLRLAKSYYDSGRYQEALDQYDNLASNAPDGFADIPVVGRAQCLEAMGKYGDALLLAIHKGHIHTVLRRQIFQKPGTDAFAFIGIFLVNV